MKIGYSSERLHHALQPLFLNIAPNAEYQVGVDDETTLWYISEQENSYQIRKNEECVTLAKDIYGLKRWVYDNYRKNEGIVLPWGIVSGIRPTKLARKIWQNHSKMSIHHFKDQLWQEDRISQEKAQLLWEVLQTENKYLTDTQKSLTGIHIYIGIPFCPSRCYYCSFAAGVLKEDDLRLQRYVGLLEKEMDALGDVWRRQRVKTIYIGGGTPTLLTESLLERLLAKLAKAYGEAVPVEFTVEAGRPDTITDGKLAILKRYGVSRISINPQTFSDVTLQKIGRNHSVKQIYEAFVLAKEHGFLINMDLILGLEREGEKEAEDNLKKVKELSPDNITLHTLTPKRGADLTNEQREKIHKESRSIGTMLDLWQNKLTECGWYPYYLYRQKNIYFENVGYAKSGTECIYNMETMLERESVIALGAGSISKKISAQGITRYDMPKDFSAYEKAVINRLDEKVKFFEREKKD